MIHFNRSCDTVSFQHYDHRPRCLISSILIVNVPKHISEETLPIDKKILSSSRSRMGLGSLLEVQCAELVVMYVNEAARVYIRWTWHRYEIGRCAVPAHFILSMSSNSLAAIFIPYILHNKIHQSCDGPPANLRGEPVDCRISQMSRSSVG